MKQYMAADERTIEEVFHAAREKPRAERAAFVRQFCQDNPENAALIESLPASSEAAEDFLETPAAELMVAPRREAPGKAVAGARIGNYRIVRTIGAGGMGVVYEAQQTAPRRTVALKLLRRAFHSEAAVRRFRREAEVLGRLSHAGIAQVFEAGIEDEAGECLPFFTMELLVGAQPLTKYAEAQGLSVRQRVELLCDVCAAVQYCHERGVIHRDLKPANILVTPAGQTKVIDFGTAHLQAPAESEAALTTEIPLMGSLPYMSPEQAGGVPGAVDRQTDVYALGVVAYELLGGCLPHDLRELPPLDAARTIREEEPVRLGIVNRRCRGDLETIVATAMAKDKARRYPSVEALAQDLARFLSAKPIRARSPSLGYRAAMFVRRHRVLVGVGALSAAVLLAATAVSTLFAVRADRQRMIAREAEAVAIAQREAADYQSYLANIAAADAALRVHDVAEARRRLDRAPAALRNWEWRFLHSRLDHSLHTLAGHEGIVGSVDFSPDGKRLVTGAAGWGFHDPVVRVWDVAGGELVRELRGHGGSVAAARFHPQNARHIVTGANDKTVRFWDLSTGKAITTPPQPAWIAALSYDADGTVLVSLDDAGGIRFWDPDSGAARGSLMGHTRRECQSFMLMPRGDRILCGGLDGVLRVFDAADGRVLSEMTGHTAPVLGLDVSPDGGLIASASEDLTVRLWGVASEAELITLRGHAASVLAVAFAPGDEFVLASASTDNTVVLWRVSGDPPKLTGETPAILHGHEAHVASIAFSPDGSLIATGSADKTAKLWDVTRTDQPSVLRGHAAMVRTLTFSPDGRWIASGDFERTIRVWDVERKVALVTLSAEAQRVQALAFHPDQSLLAAACDDGNVRIWETRHWNEVRTLRADEKAAHALAFSADGRILASGGKESSVRIWDVASGALQQSLDLQSDWIESLAFSPAAKSDILAAGCRNGSVHLIDARLALSLRSFNLAADAVTMVRWAPNGLLGASAHVDGTVRLWDPGGNELRKLVGHAAIANAIAFSPDGTRLASAGSDTTVRVWDPATGESLTTLRAHEHWVLGVAFSPDGERIVSGGGSYDGSDCALRVWHAPPAGVE